jgi:hypothetical protein
MVKITWSNIGGRKRTGWTTSPPPPAKIIRTQLVPEPPYSARIRDYFLTHLITQEQVTGFYAHGKELCVQKVLYQLEVPAAMAVLVLLYGSRLGVLGKKGGAHRVDYRN